MSPRRSIATVALIVRDYDEAIAFYVGRLGFMLATDTPLGEGKRWVTVRPQVGQGAALLLAEAADETQAAAIGRQGAGRVFLLLETEDFRRDHAAFTARGVRFLEEPRSEAYGIVAVFEDLYGNRWDLIQPSLPDEADVDPPRMDGRDEPGRDGNRTTIRVAGTPGRD